MRPVATTAYSRPSPSAGRPPAALRRLSDRLDVEPRVIRGLAKMLELDLYWLDIASRADVVCGQPADWDGCLALCIDPVSGEPLPTEGPA